jgi:hypothetical protein
MDNKLTLTPIETNEYQKKAIAYSNNLFRNNWDRFRHSDGYILLHKSQNATRNWEIDGECKF